MPGCPSEPGDLSVLDRSQPNRPPGWANDGPGHEVDPEIAFGEPSRGRDRRLDLAENVRVDLLERVEHTPGAVGGIAVDRERSAGRARRVIGFLTARPHRSDPGHQRSAHPITRATGSRALGEGRPSTGFRDRAKVETATCRTSHTPNLSAMRSAPQTPWPTCCNAGWGAGEITHSPHAFDLRVVREVPAQRSPMETGFAHVLSRVGGGVLVGPAALACCLVVSHARSGGSAVYRDQHGWAG